MASSSNNLNSAGSSGGVHNTEGAADKTLIALVLCSVAASVAALLVTLFRGK